MKSKQARLNFGSALIRAALPRLGLFLRPFYNCSLPLTVYVSLLFLPV
jgi:hypothetical protein